MKVDSTVSELESDKVVLLLQVATGARIDTINNAIDKAFDQYMAKYAAFRNDKKVYAEYKRLESEYVSAKEAFGPIDEENKKIYNMDIERNAAKAKGENVPQLTQQEQENRAFIKTEYDRLQEQLSKAQIKYEELTPKTKQDFLESLALIYRNEKAKNPENASESNSVLKNMRINIDRLTSQNKKYNGSENVQRLNGMRLMAIGVALKDIKVHVDNKKALSDQEREENMKMAAQKIVAYNVERNTKKPVQLSASEDFEKLQGHLINSVSWDSTKIKVRPDAKTHFENLAEDIKNYVNFLKNKPSGVEIDLAKADKIQSFLKAQNEQFKDVPQFRKNQISEGLIDNLQVLEKELNAAVKEIKERVTTNAHSDAEHRSSQEHASAPRADSSPQSSRLAGWAKKGMENQQERRAEEKAAQTQHVSVKNN